VERRESALSGRQEFRNRLFTSGRGISRASELRPDSNLALILLLPRFPPHKSFLCDAQPCATQPFSLIMATRRVPATSAV
jgi:hypothetical protein